MEALKENGDETEAREADKSGDEKDEERDEEKEDGQEQDEDEESEEEKDKQVPIVKKFDKLRIAGDALADPEVADTNNATTEDAGIFFFQASSFPFRFISPLFVFSFYSPSASQFSSLLSVFGYL